MAQRTYIARKGEDADFANVTASGTLAVTGAATLAGAVTHAGAQQFNNALTVGVDDTGYDVKFFGATSGVSMLWDESADKLIITNGTADLGTSCEADAYTVGGVSGVDFGPAAVSSITVVKGLVTAIS